MDAAGYRMAEALHAAIGTPARFSPLTIDGTAKMLVSHQMGGFPGLTPHLDAERAELVVYVGVNPVVSHGHTSAMPDPVTAIRALRDRSGGVGRRSPSHRDRAAGHAPSRAATRAPTTRSSRSWCAKCCSDGADRDDPRAPHGGKRRVGERGRTLHARARGDDRRRPGVRPDRAPRRSATGRASRRRDGNRRHDVGERQRDAVARVGADDPDRFDEPPRRRVVPSGLPPPARVVRAPDLTARRAVRARAHALVPSRSPSSASGRARCSATRSAPATSARC